MVRGELYPALKTWCASTCCNHKIPFNLFFMESSALFLFQTTEKNWKMLSPASSICELLISDQSHCGGLGELWTEVGLKLACFNCLLYTIAEVLASLLPLLIRKRIDHFYILYFLFFSRKKFSQLQEVWCHSSLLLLLLCVPLTRARVTISGSCWNQE